MSDAIRERARRLVNRTGTRDPFKLARLLGVEIMFRDDMTEQKGAFFVVLEQAFIIINSNLDEQMQRLVCAHELGHAVLHKAQAARGALCEFDLFAMATGMEYEANVFASEVLIDTRELKEYLREGQDVYACASALDTSVNLILVKLADFVPVEKLPFEPERGFMGNI